MDELPQKLISLREYATKVQETEYFAEPRDGNLAYQVQLNDTLQKLHTRVQQHRVALKEVYLASSSLR